MRRAFCTLTAVFVMLAPVAATAADFTGRWDSNFGIIELTQKAASVSGTYAGLFSSPYVIRYARG